MVISKTIYITIYNLFFWIYFFVQSENIVEDEYTGSTFQEIDNYLGVTVVVNLIDERVVYCMGLMVNWNTDETEGVFEYVVTTATCLKQEGISEISVCIQGSPFVNTCSFTKGILDDRIFYHPLHEKLPPLGNVALIRMSENYSGKTYPITKLSPKYLSNFDKIKRGITVLMWSNSLDYKPPKYNVERSSSVLQQLQTIIYSMDINHCPFSSEDNKVADIEKKYWYMFMCADFMAPTRNGINNPGAQLFFEKSILALHSHSFTKDIDKSSSKAKIKTAQVHRYSLLYWYVPWIERTIASDMNRKGESAYDDEYTMTRLPTTSAASGPAATDPSEYYNPDSVYDDLAMSSNPCGDESTSSAGRLGLQTARFGLAFFAGVTFSSGLLV